MFRMFMIMFRMFRIMFRMIGSCLGCLWSCLGCLGSCLGCLWSCLGWLDHCRWCSPCWPARRLWRERRRPSGWAHACLYSAWTDLRWLRSSSPPPCQSWWRGSAPVPPPRSERTNQETESHVYFYSALYNTNQFKAALQKTTVIIQINSV